MCLCKSDWQVAQSAAQKAQLTTCGRARPLLCISIHVICHQYKILPQWTLKPCVQHFDSGHHANRKLKTKDMSQVSQSWTVLCFFIYPYRWKHITYNYSHWTWIKYIVSEANVTNISSHLDQRETDMLMFKPSYVVMAWRPSALCFLMCYCTWYIVFPSILNRLHLKYLSLSVPHPLHPVDEWPFHTVWYVCVYNMRSRKRLITFIWTRCFLVFF